jgi:hypothetical protein
MKARDSCMIQAHKQRASFRLKISGYKEQRKYIIAFTSKRHVQSVVNGNTDFLNFNQQPRKSRFDVASIYNIIVEILPVHLHFAIRTIEYTRLTMRFTQLD